MVINIKRIFFILYNRLKFKLLNINYGSKLRIYDSIYIRKKGNNFFKIGNHFTISSGGNYNPIARNIKAAIELEKNAKIEIGNKVGMSSPCLRIYDYLKIGNNVKIGADVIIIDSDSHSLNYEIRRTNEDRDKAKRAGITIGNDVLIGTRTIILKGVTIGDRVVIGAGSVVSKSIPSDCIAAGNPCKIIKFTNNA